MWRNDYFREKACYCYYCWTFCDKTWQCWSVGPCRDCCCCCCCCWGQCSASRSKKTRTKRTRSSSRRRAAAIERPRWGSRATRRRLARWRWSSLRRYRLSLRGNRPLAEARRCCSFFFFVLSAGCCWLFSASLSLYLECTAKKQTEMFGLSLSLARRFICLRRQKTQNLTNSLSHFFFYFFFYFLSKSLTLKKFEINI